MLHNGEPGVRKELLHDVLIHACRRAEHARANVGDARELKQTLDGAIFAESAVQHGKHDVERLAIKPRLDIGPGRRRGSLARIGRFGSHKRRNSLMQ